MAKANEALLPIEIAYALPNEQFLLTMAVKPGTTIAEAIAQSPLLEKVPGLKIETLVVGVFSKRRALTDLVAAGDRIEIYRPLIIDPKTARRQRAKKRKT